jgi:hypothetical protein
MYQRKDEVTKETIALALLFAALFSAGLVGLISWLG